jgi:pyruvate ferredoxin oxidoreductase gamma subunit
MKTASRILGTAFFAEGFEVQDAPRYGAERRGAPIFAYVRASRKPIHERGILRRPDLVVIADESLMGVAAAGVLSGVAEHTVLLLNTAEPPDVWLRRLQFGGRLVTLRAEAEAQAELRFVGASCAAAAARLTGVISRDALAQAIREELADMAPQVVEATFEELAPEAGCVQEGPDPAADAYTVPEWVDLPFEPTSLSAPDIHGSATSVQVRTGLWRTMRPVIDLERCHGCSWICSTFCPDGAVLVDAEGVPSIDYEHCKGCLVCVAVCPHHAIDSIPEREAAEEVSA